MTTTEHHWGGVPPDPYKYLGFIYLITHAPTGRWYVGRKVYWYSRRKRVKGRTNRRVITTESDWRTYTGSSKELNAFMEGRDKEEFSFEILFQGTTKSVLRYWETAIIICWSAILDTRSFNYQCDPIRGRVSGECCPDPYRVIEERT